MGYHKKTEPIQTSESMEYVQEPILTAESLITEETTVATELSNNEQVPWHNDLFKTPKTYETRDLHEWHEPPPMVSRNPKGYGEMGKIFSSIKIQ